MGIWRESGKNCIKNQSLFIANQVDIGTKRLNNGYLCSKKNPISVRCISAGLSKAQKSLFLETIFG